MAASDTSLFTRNNPLETFEDKTKQGQDIKSRDIRRFGHLQHVTSLGKQTINDTVESRECKERK